MLCRRNNILGLLSLCLFFVIDTTLVLGRLVLSKEYTSQNSNLRILKAKKGSADSFQTSIARSLKILPTLENKEIGLNNSNNGNNFLSEWAFIFIEIPSWMPIEIEEYQDILSNTFFMFLSKRLRKEIPEYVDIVSVELSSYVAMKRKASKVSDKEHGYYFVTFIVNGLVEVLKAPDDFVFGRAINLITQPRYYQFLDEYFEGAGLYNNFFNATTESWRDGGTISVVAQISKNNYSTWFYAAFLFIAIQAFAVCWYTRPREKRPLTIIKPNYIYSNSNKNDDHMFEKDDRPVDIPVPTELSKKIDNEESELEETNGNSSMSCSIEPKIGRTRLVLNDNIYLKGNALADLLTEPGSVAIVPLAGLLTEPDSAAIVVTEVKNTSAMSGLFSKHMEFKNNCLEVQK